MNSIEFIKDRMGRVRDPENFNQLFEIDSDMQAVVLDSLTNIFESKRHLTMDSNSVEVKQDIDLNEELSDFRERVYNDGDKKVYRATMKPTSHPEFYMMLESNGTVHIANGNSDVINYLKGEDDFLIRGNFDSSVYRLSFEAHYNNDFELQPISVNITKYNKETTNFDLQEKCTVSSFKELNDLFLKMNARNFKEYHPELSNALEECVASEGLTDSNIQL